MAGTRPGSTPVEQQERSEHHRPKNRPVQRSISGPGAADFLAAPGELDTPESGGKGMAQTRDDGLVQDERRHLPPRLALDTDDAPMARVRKINGRE